MKHLVFGCMVLISTTFLSACATIPPATREEGSSSSLPLLGGDRDSYGCIPSAGYSWCEAKQKCLRPWEEACTGNTSSTDTASWETYTNTRLGFSLKLPPSWEGFRATEGSFPTYTYVSFSFGGQRQPFEIFKVLRYSDATWAEVRGNPNITILSDTGNPPLVCDGCCRAGGDTSGGGQFDAFQKERCSEVPSILATFALTQTDEPVRASGRAAGSEPPFLLGGDRDEYGCIPSAGYQWCAAKQKCLRIWEESCAD